MNKKILQVVWVIAVLVFVGMWVRQCGKAEAAEPWQPAHWWLEPVGPAPGVGDTMTVRVMFDVPDVSIVQFYRAGVACDPTLEIIDLAIGPDAHACADFLTINYTPYEDWSMVWLDGGATCSGWSHWDGHVATIRLLVLGNGNVWLQGGQNMNHIFPTSEYYARTPEAPCPDAPWAYATEPQNFNGTDHPCVAPLILGAADTPSDVLSVTTAQWSAVKQLYR